MTITIDEELAARLRALAAEKDEEPNHYAAARLAEAIAEAERQQALFRAESDPEEQERLRALLMKRVGRIHSGGSTLADDAETAIGEILEEKRRAGRL